MVKKNSKGLLMATLICGTIAPVVFSGASVYAAEKDEVDAALQAFELDQMRRFFVAQQGKLSIHVEVDNGVLSKHYSSPFLCFQINPFFRPNAKPALANSLNTGTDSYYDTDNVPRTP